MDNKKNKKDNKVVAISHLYDKLGSNNIFFQK